MSNKDWETIRNDFPILQTVYNGHPLVYFDSSATSQKPKAVIDSISSLYTTYNANIHRGVYRMSEETTKKYIESKEKIARYINASSYKSIVYTRNTTDSLNTIALMLEKEVKQGDDIIISLMEHHSNLIPWMKLAERTGATLKYIPITKEGEIDIPVFFDMLSDNTKILAISHVSNVLGTINPIKQMVSAVRDRGGYSVVDGAQAVGHIGVDVADLDADFYAFSGHKMLGPTGIGIVYAKENLLERLDPVYFGGDMISHVEMYSIEYNEIPWKFEAGTSNFEGGIALGAAVDYLETIGIENIQDRNEYLRQLLERYLCEMPGVRIYGVSKNKTSVISFTVDGIHPHDMASLLDKSNICIRAGNHCAQPLVDSFGCSAVARASLHFYNNEKDIELFINALQGVQKLFSNG